MCNRDRNRTRGSSLQLRNLSLSRSQLLLQLRLTPTFDGRDNPANRSLGIQREIILPLGQSFDRLLQQPSRSSQAFHRGSQLVFHLNLHALFAFPFG
jgi:hypothetical protein